MTTPCVLLCRHPAHCYDKTDHATPNPSKRQAARCPTDSSASRTSTGGYRASSAGYRAFSTSGYRAFPSSGYRAFQTSGYRAPSSSSYRASSSVNSICLIRDCQTIYFPCPSVGK